MADIKQKVRDFLEKNQHLNLATIKEDGKPIVATVAYASEDDTLFVATSKKTRKYQNILNNPNVGFTSDVDDVQKSLQMEGVAEPVSDKEEADKAMGLLLTKFPQMKNMPPNPDMVILKIKLTEGYMLDFTVGFMHRDPVTY